MSNDAILGGLIGFGLGAGFVAASGALSSVERVAARGVPVRLQWEGRQDLSGPPPGPPGLLSYFGARVVGTQALGASGSMLEAKRWAVVDDQGAQIEADPGMFAEYVQGFGVLMAEAERNLEVMRQRARELGQLVEAQGYPQGSAPWREARAAGQRWAALKARFDELAAGFWEYARPATPEEQRAASQGGRNYAKAAQAQRSSELRGHFGAAPPAVVIAVVAGVAVSIAAIAWCIASWQEAQALRDRTALETQELEARVEAMRTGGTLQPSTVPEPKDNSSTYLAAGGLMLAGLYLLSEGGAFNG